MARPTSSLSVSRSSLMMTMTRHHLCHCLPHLRVPAFSPCQPRQANHFYFPCLRYRRSRLLQRRLRIRSLTTDTLLPNLTTLRGAPRFIILLALSRPLIDASISISTPVYAGFRPRPPSNLSLPLSAASASRPSLWASARRRRHFVAPSSYALTLKNSK